MSRDRVQIPKLALATYVMKSILTPCMRLRPYRQQVSCQPYGDGRGLFYFNILVTEIIKAGHE